MTKIEEAERQLAQVRELVERYHFLKWEEVGSTGARTACNRIVVRHFAVDTWSASICTREMGRREREEIHVPDYHGPTPLEAVVNALVENLRKARAHYDRLDALLDPDDPRLLFAHPGEIRCGDCKKALHRADQEGGQ